MLNAKDATKLAQRILAQSVPGLEQDGWWGTYTNGAFVGASPAVQGAVREVLKAAGTAPEQLLAASRTIVAKSEAMGDGWVAESYVHSVIDREAARQGVDADLMRGFLKLEAINTTRDGVKYYNAKSVSPNGHYHGLFQMGSPAWLDAKGLLPDLPSFLAGRYDAAANTRAAVGYVRLNERYARAAGYKGVFSPEVLYALHNQGAGGFMRLLKEQRMNEDTAVQSKEAQRIIKLAMRQNGVNVA